MSANVILALEAVSLALDVLQTLGRLVPGISTEVSAASALVRAAKAEGRDLTDAELGAIRALVDVARVRAEEAVASIPADEPARE
ncbi:MAG: hypothetical protein KA761_00270 [Gemmatimonadaceae bacterium]|nr:hypothetical protein [Gemmatimonadaceae bacterium]